MDNEIKNDDTKDEVGVDNTEVIADTLQNQSEDDSKKQLEGKSIGLAKQKIWERPLFIISASIITCGFYFLYYVLIKKKGKNGAIIASVILAGVLLIGAVGNLLQPKGTIEKTIKTYAVTEKYTIPAEEAKAAVYEVKDAVSIFVGDIDEGRPEVFVGEGVPTGTYKITALDQDRYCSLMLKNKNDFEKYGGKQVYINQEITLTEANKLSAFNCGTFGDGGLNVTLTPSGQPKLLEPEKKAVPAKAVTEQLRSNEYKTGCLQSIDNNSLNVIDCSSLIKLQELEQKMIESNKELILTRVEKLTITGKNEKCYVDGEATDCENLLSYEDLKEQIEIK